MGSMLEAVYIDEAALTRAGLTAEGLEGAIKAETERIRERAEQLSKGLRTEETVVYATGEHVGGTAPVWGSDVQMFWSKEARAYTPIGIVYTANYSAMKFNLRNNILLKARG